MMQHLSCRPTYLPTHPPTHPHTHTPTPMDPRMAMGEAISLSAVHAIMYPPLAATSVTQMVRCSPAAFSLCCGRGWVGGWVGVTVPPLSVSLGISLTLSVSLVPLAVPRRFRSQLQSPRRS